MSQELFDELPSLLQTTGREAVIERLIATLRREKRYHALFDALCLRCKSELNLPLVHPTSFDDVPAELRPRFEESYIAAAREIGAAFLGEKDIPQAWVYLRTIRAPESIAAAIDALSPTESVPEEILDIALFQGVHPVKGLRLSLASHGTCSTVTAFDQLFPQLPPAARRDCAAILVRRVYEALRDSVRSDVLRRQPMLPPGASLRELILGRDWIFADDNYHVDVSHLHAVVRFGRALEPGRPELKLASELALYGSRLAKSYQYAGNPPFEDYYPAHLAYFKVLLGEDTETGLNYFRDRLGEDVENHDNQLVAFVLVDLLERLGRMEAAAELACRYLVQVSQDLGISIADLCLAAKRPDLLLSVSRHKQDPVAFAAALLQTAPS